MPLEVPIVLLPTKCFILIFECMIYIHGDHRNWFFLGQIVSGNISSVVPFRSIHNSMSDSVIWVARNCK